MLRTLTIALILADERLIWEWQRLAKLKKALGEETETKSLIGSGCR